MRITCPSCSAVYEAPDEAIGAGGRVVECSDCGARWMQPGPPMPKAPTVPAETSAGEPRMPGLSEAAQAMSALKASEPPATPAPQVPTPPPAAPPPAASTPAASTPAPPPAAAPVSSAPPKATTAPEVEAPKRRDVASIDARDLVAQLREAEAEEEPSRGSGRAVGFVLALIISAGLAFAYIERERVAEAAPQAAPYLDRYAAVVDDVRRAVEGVAAQVRGMIDGG